MWIIQEPKKAALWNKRHFEEKNEECAACLKYWVFIFVEKYTYKMQHLEGSGRPVLYIGRTVLKGETSTCVWLRVCFVCLFIQLLTAALRLIVRSWLDVPFFVTRRLHACHHTRAPSGERWNCGRKMSRKFCLNIALHVTFMDLLHAVKLRHGTDGFTSPPNEGVLRIFSP
jgi:hypothetical protein